MDTFCLCQCLPFCWNKIFLFQEILPFFLFALSQLSYYEDWIFFSKAFLDSGLGARFPTPSLRTLGFIFHSLCLWQITNIWGLKCKRWLSIAGFNLSPPTKLTSKLFKTFKIFPKLRVYVHTNATMYVEVKRATCEKLPSLLLCKKQGLNSGC